MKFLLVGLLTILITIENIDAEPISNDTCYPILVYLQTSDYSYERINIPIDNPDLKTKFEFKNDKLLLKVQYKNINCRTSICNAALCLTDSIIVILNPVASKKDVSVIMSMPSGMILNRKQIFVDTKFYSTGATNFHTIYVCKPHGDWYNYCSDENVYYYREFKNDNNDQRRIKSNIVKYYKTDKTFFLHKAMTIVNNGINNSPDNNYGMYIFDKIYLCKKLYLFQEGYDFIRLLPDNLKKEYLGRNYNFNLKNFQSGIYHQKKEYEKRDSINKVLSDNLYKEFLWNSDYFSSDFNNYILTKLRYTNKDAILEELNTYPVNDNRDSVDKEILIKQIERFDLKKIYGN